MALSCAARRALALGLVAALTSSLLTSGCGSSRGGGSSTGGSNNTGGFNNTGGSNNTGSSTPAIQIASGDRQAALVDSMLPAPLVVALLAGSTPAVGATVTFTASGDATLSTTSTTTDANGIAQTSLTFGSTPGPVSVTVSVVGLSSVVFTETSETSATISISGGNNQSGEFDTGISPIVVLATDSNGQPLEGVTVHFLVTGGGGTVYPDNAVTDKNGHAETQWTLGAIGDNTVSASVAGFAGSPVTFMATGTP